jgi:hypothetical protein
MALIASKLQHQSPEEIVDVFSVRGVDLIRNPTEGFWNQYR